MKVITVDESGFCFGVKRAIGMLKQAAQEYGDVETLGSLVHNEQVMQRLKARGVKTISSLDEITGDTVAISAHGLSPGIEAELKEKGVKIVDTTCPRVQRAQKVARKLSEEGYFVIIFGDEKHPEVKGILGWVNGQGSAVLEAKQLVNWDRIPRKLGIMSQTTQIPERFIRFIKDVIDLTLTEGTEIQIIDTLCEGVRKRQSQSLEVARQADLMLVVGGTSSANTKRLLEICSAVTESYLIGKMEDINPDWLKGKKIVGITSGTSTSEETINEVIDHVKRFC
jgi:4-hydroxy-3-methylbut-2-enyl diphosphate reductase